MLRLMNMNLITTAVYIAENVKSIIIIQLILENKLVKSNLQIRKDLTFLMWPKWTCICLQLF